MEPAERRGLDVPPVLMRDGGEADRPRQTPGGGAGVHREIGDRRRLHLMRLDQDHPQQEDGHQQEQDEPEGGGEDSLHGSQALEKSTVGKNRGGFRAFVCCSKA